MRHGSLPLLMSVIIGCLGVYMMGAAVVSGGGIQSYGVLIGPLFMIAGFGRAWLTIKRARSLEE